MDQRDLIKTIVEALCGQLNGEPPKTVSIPVGVSNRHVHLCQADVERLFGEGHQLQPVKELSQPGYYVSRETVTLAGPKGAISGVKVLGPTRPHTQVELLQTDTFLLGIKAEVRESGRRAESQPITIVGPEGSVTEKMGVLVAMRHIHTSPVEAQRLGVHDGQVVAVRITGPRAGVLEQVVIRIAEGLHTEMHIDIDEANAMAIKNGQTVELML